MFLSTDPKFTNRPKRPWFESICFVVNPILGGGGGGGLGGNFGTDVRASFFETYPNHIIGLRKEDDLFISQIHILD